MGIILEGALVVAALLIAGALAGYLYHERMMLRRTEVFVDRATVRGFLERRHGITLSQDDWDAMTRNHDESAADRGTMLGPGQ